jgi:hypothetical protein
MILIFRLRQPCYSHFDQLKLQLNFFEFKLVPYASLVLENYLHRSNFCEVIN